MKSMEMPDAYRVLVKHRENYQKVCQRWFVRKKTKQLVGNAWRDSFFNDVWTFKSPDHSLVLFVPLTPRGSWHIVENELKTAKLKRSEVDKLWEYYYAGLADPSYAGTIVGDGWGERLKGLAQTKTYQLLVGPTTAADLWKIAILDDDNHFPQQIRVEAKLKVQERLRVIIKVDAPLALDYVLKDIFWKPGSNAAGLNPPELWPQFCKKIASLITSANIGQQIANRFPEGLPPVIQTAFDNAIVKEVLAADYFDAALAIVHQGRPGLLCQQPLLIEKLLSLTEDFWKIWAVYEEISDIPLKYPGVTMIKKPAIKAAQQYLDLVLYQCFQRWIPLDDSRLEKFWQVYHWLDGIFPSEAQEKMLDAYQHFLKNKTSEEKGTAEPGQ